MRPRNNTRKVLITEKAQNAYRLRVFYFLGLEPVFSYYWPVLLQHTPEEVDEYIAQSNISGALADSLRRWYFSGYSIYENGYFLGRENGSTLDYVGAYRLALAMAQSIDPSVVMAPMDFYMVSTCRRPCPAVLQDRIMDVCAFADMYDATPGEERALWDWVYRGKSIYKNPAGTDGRNYIEWSRDFDAEIEEYRNSGIMRRGDEDDTDF